MKILKRIILVLVTLIAIPLVIALFVKKEYTVVREVTISKPRQEVFEYLRYLKNQDNFSVWAKMDPGMQKTYRGTDGTVGFVAGWDSQKDDVGKGEQEIMGITEGQRIDYEIRFIEPFESVAKASMLTADAAGSATRVTWTFDGKMPYPMNFMMLIWDMDEMLGKDLQTGLNDLKTILENR